MKEWQREATITTIVFVVGFVYGHHGMVLSSFARTPGDPGDAVLVRNLIELEYRAIARIPPLASIWDTPIVYPKTNVAAYSDLFLGVLPYYAIWRVLGVGQEHAYQLWLLTVSVLNFLSIYLLLRHCLRVNVLSANAGAFLFSFANMRMFHEWHPQLLPQFYVVAAVYGLWRLFTAEGERQKEKQRIGLWIAGFAATAQFYSAFYWGWFFFFGCLIALLMVCAGLTRQQVYQVVRQHAWVILAVAGVCGSLLAPAMWHWAEAARDFGGMRPYETVRNFLPGLPSWVKQSSQNYLYGWLDQYLKFDQPPAFWEGSYGLGLATTLMVIWGFWLGRKNPLVRLLAFLSIALFVLSLRLPNGFSLWMLVYDVVPGAKAVRAVGRLPLFMLFSSSIALAVFMNRWSPSRAFLAFVFMAGEQGLANSTMSIGGYQELVMEAAKPVEQNCEAMYFSPPAEGWSDVLGHNVGISAALMLGIPSVNSSTGGLAPGYEVLQDNLVRDERDRARLEAALKRWIGRFPGRIQEICWVAPTSDPKALVLRRIKATAD